MSPQVNAPVETTTLTDAEVIEVTDPTHPLYGRRFPLARLCQAPHGQGFAEVLYRDTIRLRIPVVATNRSLVPAVLSPTKLSLEAIQQLVALVKECRSPCPSHRATFGPDSPKS